MGGGIPRFGQMYFRHNVDFRRYRAVELDYPDVTFENRESPTEHRYRTAVDAPRVIIAERVSP